MTALTPHRLIERAVIKIHAAEADVTTARADFADLCADLWDNGNGLPYQAIGDLAGLGKQRVHQLVQASRARQSEAA